MDVMCRSCRPSERITEANMRAVVQTMQSAGVISIVTGSPGAVDTKYFARPGATPDQYDDSLDHLRAIDEKLAGELHTAFADVHTEMMTAMTKAKAALGAEYDVCGTRRCPSRSQRPPPHGIGVSQRPGARWKHWRPHRGHGGSEQCQRRAHGIWQQRERGD